MTPQVQVHHHGKLVVDLKRSGRTLTMRVLEQGEELRNACKYEVLFIAQCGNYNLASEGVPELLSRSMLVRGMRTSGDDDESSLTYPTESAAISAESAFRAMIAAVNGGKGEVKAGEKPPACPYVVPEGCDEPTRKIIESFQIAWHKGHSAGAASRQADVDAAVARAERAEEDVGFEEYMLALESENKALREACNAALLDVTASWMLKNNGAQVPHTPLMVQLASALALRTLGGEGGGE